MYIFMAREQSARREYEADNKSSESVAKITYSVWERRARRHSEETEVRECLQPFGYRTFCIPAPSLSTNSKAQRAISLSCFVRVLKWD